MRIRKVASGEEEQTLPQFEPLQAYPGMGERPDWLAFFAGEKK